MAKQERRRILKMQLERWWCYLYFRVYCIFGVKCAKEIALLTVCCYTKKKKVRMMHMMQHEMINNRKEYTQGRKVF